MEIGIILPACEIPDGSIVTKRTGTYRHMINKRIPIYGKVKGGPREMKQQGIVFIIKIDDPEYITALKDDTMLIWWTTEEKYYDHLSWKTEENQSK